MLLLLLLLMCRLLRELSVQPRRVCSLIVMRSRTRKGRPPALLDELMFSLLLQPRQGGSGTQTGKV